MSQRRPWTSEQDKIIIQLVNCHGTKKWTTIAQEMQKCYHKKTRTSKQIRQRWHNHLDPSVSKREWTDEEQRILFQSHRLFGSKWKQIASRLEGRTDNHVKNYFYSTMRRALRRVNKFLGYKNSTSQMRAIRPSILSYLLDLADTNSQIRSLVNKIIQFSKFKPTRISKQNTFLDSDKENYQVAINKLMKINQAYSKKGSRKLHQLQEPKLKIKEKQSYKYPLQNTTMQNNQNIVENEIKIQVKQQVIQQQQQKIQQNWQDQNEQSNQYNYNYHTMPDIQKPQYQCDLLLKKQQHSEPTEAGHYLHYDMAIISNINRQLEHTNLFQF